MLPFGDRRHLAATALATHSADMTIMPPVDDSSFALGGTTVTSATLSRRSLRALCFVLLAALATSCGYNEVIDRDESVKAAWAEVQNQYKRRADLVPNLVNTVKASANFEKETLEAVIKARASATQVTVDASTIDDPAKLQQFERAQAQLGGALGRLLVTAEKYPDLKASAQFRDLQAQLEGTENRISVARNRYIESVAEYNKTVLRFPSSLGASIRGKKERPSFAGDPANEAAPTVKF